MHRNMSCDRLLVVNNLKYNLSSRKDRKPSLKWMSSVRQEAVTLHYDKDCPLWAHESGYWANINYCRHGNRISSRMVSSGLLRRVALVRTDVSKEPGALVFLRSVRRLLVAACVVPSSPISVTLMKEAPDSSKTSVLTRTTRRNNPEDTILHSHCRENLKSYTSFFSSIQL
jgi:hypothetical protein